MALSPSLQPTWIIQLLLQRHIRAKGEKAWFLILEACLCCEDKYHYYLKSQEDPDYLEAQFQVPLFLLSVLGSLRVRSIKRETQRVREFYSNIAQIRIFHG